MADETKDCSMSHMSIPTSDLTSTLSMSASANPMLGFDETNKFMRSSLMHPTCFPLLCYLNDVPRDSTISDTVLHNFIWNTIDSVTVDRTDTDDCVKRENVFAATALDWGGDEPDFTKKLLFNINYCGMVDSLLTVDGEKQIQGVSIFDLGRVDMICYKKNGDMENSDDTNTNQSRVVTTAIPSSVLTTGSANPSSVVASANSSSVLASANPSSVENKDDASYASIENTANPSFVEDKRSSVVALFEFALENKVWWRKQHQLLNYVKLLRANADRNYKIDQPVLLSVITINKTSKIDDDKIIGWSKKTELTDQDKSNTFNSNLMRAMNTSTTELPMENIPFNVRFGVFLCIPKGENEFRIALLWRHDSSTLRDASTQFGKILYAIQLCTKMSEASFQNEHMIPYQYLGPNCCKIGTSVCNMHAVWLYFSHEVNLLFE